MQQLFASNYTELTRWWVVNRVQTYTGHSIAFNMFLHFVTL